MTGVDRVGAAAVVCGESSEASGVNLSAVRVLLRRVDLPADALGLEESCPLMEETGPGNEEEGVGTTNGRLG